MTREHAQLTKRLADLEASMRAAGVPVPRALGNGLGNTMSLHGALEHVMRGKVMWQCRTD